MEVKVVRINYDIFKKGKTVPISRDMKEELKDDPIILNQKVTCKCIR